MILSPILLSGTEWPVVLKEVKALKECGLLRLEAANQSSS